MNKTFLGEDCWLSSNVFDLNYLEHLKIQILSSPYLTANQYKLSSSFARTKGFSLVFKHSSISRAERQFPFFQVYLKATLLPECNAFYLNALVLDRGTEVKKHFDSTLSCHLKQKAIPDFVSVLYVQVPSNMQGGELVLHKDERQIVLIQPQTNTLIDFCGKIEHSVNQVQSSQARISLVCEQYSLSDRQLQLIPDFEIQSDAIVTQQDELKLASRI